MEWGILLFTVIGVVLGGMVLQATMAAQHWRKAISAGDASALREAVTTAFEAWRRQKPPKGYPPADWQALLSATVVAMDMSRCRVSLLATPDVRVVNNQRHQLGAPLDVARRTAVRMAERLLYDIPYVRFEEVQIDAYSSYMTADGDPRSDCILVTRVTREDAAMSPWDTEDDVTVLAGWDTREAVPGHTVDPDLDALIALDAQAAVAAAEEALRRASK